MTKEDKNKKEKNLNCSCSSEKIDIKKILKFPCCYLFKIAGKGDFNIEKIILKIEESLKKKIPRSSLKMKISSGGKYASYTLNTTLENFEELEKIYKILKNDSSVIFYL